MSDLPSGTVTFVFTDIEDSTEHLKRLGDAYADVLSAHRRIVRDTLGARDGVEIDTQGDAFFYVFRRAREAVTGAVDAQREHASTDWPGDRTIRVRMGLHTGEPALHEEGYVGIDVVRAARLCSLGRGGQILLSETTQALLGSRLPDGVSVFPLGQKHLRGIDEPERVFEVAIDGLWPDESPPPAAAPDNVPAQSEPPGASDGPSGMDDLGARLAANIQERVARSLGVRTEQRADDASGVDHIAAHIAALGDEIDARIREALERGAREPRPPA